MPLPKPMATALEEIRNLLHTKPVDADSTLWLFFVYSIAWLGIGPPGVKAERRTWWRHGIDVPWNDGHEPTGLDKHKDQLDRDRYESELANYLAGSPRSRRKAPPPQEPPKNWFHFYSELTPGPLQASAEVLRWLADSVEAPLGVRPEPPDIVHAENWSTVTVGGVEYQLRGKARGLVGALFMAARKSDDSGLSYLQLKRAVNSSARRFRIENYFRKDGGRKASAYLALIHMTATDHAILNPEVARIWRAQLEAARQ